MSFHSLQLKTPCEAGRFQELCLHVAGWLFSVYLLLLFCKVGFAEQIRFGNLTIFWRVVWCRKKDLFRNKRAKKKSPIGRWPRIRCQESDSTGTLTRVYNIVRKDSIARLIQNIGNQPFYLSETCQGWRSIDSCEASPISNTAEVATSSKLKRFKVGIAIGNYCNAQGGYIYRTTL